MQCCLHIRKAMVQFGAALWPYLCGPSATRVCAIAALSLFLIHDIHAEQIAAPSKEKNHPSSAQRAAVIASFRHDASLADVFFVDANTGWAVGDRGVIWHTNDGGATWRQQSSGVASSLNSVVFVSAERGWAAGGEYDPYTGDSRGVILHTSDGGNTWKPSPSLVLPLLNRIKFLDDNTGFAVGDATAAQPAGVFVTQDGGRTWQALAAENAGGWLACDFLDAESGALAGPAGSFATLARGKVVNSSLGTPSLRAFRAMHLVAPAAGWLVGDGGLVLCTKDLGHSWQAPAGKLPEFTADNFDFRALAVVGEHVWIAGLPGSLVFHSPDGGHTWDTTATRNPTPIHSLKFVDATHGWAVGDLGNILATSDGGRTWKSQRAGAQRAAILGLFAAAADVPLELLASDGAAEGYVAAVDILHTKSQSDPTVARSQDRDVLLQAGAAAASTAWRFPLPADDLAHSSSDLLNHLNRISDGRAVEQIERNLVRSIRMWRPDLIVTHAPDSPSNDPHASILAALLNQSITAAADPSRHVVMATDLQLAPWQVKKIYSVLPPNSQGAETLQTAQFSPRLGVTLSDFVAPARQLLQLSALSSPDRYNFELIASTIQEPIADRGLFSGISLSAGSEARRLPPELPVENLDALRQAADRKRHIQALLERTEGNSAWVAQISQMIDGLSENDGAELLHELAQGYRGAGRLDLAADTSYLLARRYPDHGLAARSLEWLIQFYASSEVSHRLASHDSKNIRQAGMQVGEPIDLGDESVNQVQQAATIPADSTPTIGLARDDRLHRATQLAEYLRASRPELYAEPHVRFAEVVALREPGLSNPAKRYFLTLRQLPEANSWRRCAETEMWLSQPADLPPAKALGTCRAANESPHLDAVLDEPFWESADRLRLHADEEKPSGGPSAEVWFAYDKDFMYISVHCPKITGSDYKTLDRPRQRDTELSQHDRVAMRIDVDRDFTTAFELAVDYRGSTHDACWGDANWNPNWYVAAGQDDKSWTIEAAIPLKELTDKPPVARSVWAVSACRTIPRVGYQTWTGAAETHSPDQFGLLIFD